MGANGTGKTTLARQIIHNSGQRALIITPDDIEWSERDAAGNELYPMTDLTQNADFVFSGCRRHIYDGKKKRTLKAIQNFKKGILVFDDCRSYLTAQTDEYLHSLLIRRRQREIDLIFIVHGASDLLPKVFTFATDIFLFNTKDKLELRKPYIKNFEEVQAIKQDVDKKSLNNRHYYRWFKWK